MAEDEEDINNLRSEIEEREAELNTKEQELSRLSNAKVRKNITSTPKSIEHDCSLTSVL